MSNKAELIFMKWKADLADMDRSKAAVEGNFDILFHSMQKSKISMEDALIYLEKAIKAHQPSDYVVKSVYKSMKKFGRTETLSDFESSWKEFIANAGKRVFFSIYEIDNSEKDSAPKYGSMSASEYRKQQKYADSHPTLDWEALIREQQTSDKGPSVDPSHVDVNIDLGDL
jgi:hypothetical protein